MASPTMVAGPAFSASRIVTLADLPSDEKEQMLKFLVDNRVAVRNLGDEADAALHSEIREEANLLVFGSTNLDQLIATHAPRAPFV